MFVKCQVITNSLASSISQDNALSKPQYLGKNEPPLLFTVEMSSKGTGPASGFSGSELFSYLQLLIVYFFACPLSGFGLQAGEEKEAVPWDHELLGMGRQRLGRIRGAAAEDLTWVLWFSKKWMRTVSLGRKGHLLLGDSHAEQVTISVYCHWSSRGRREHHPCLQPSRLSWCRPGALVTWGITATWCRTIAAAHIHWWCYRERQKQHERARKNISAYFHMRGEKWKSIGR